MQSATASSQPKIAIIGGGPAGLTVGLLLHQHNIPYTIFELREKPSEIELAKPSGMLDLHPGSGLDVIQECGLYTEFEPLTGECGQDFIISDRNGKILHHNKGDGGSPEISRNNLSKLFLNHIPAENIRWGHKLVKCTTSILNNQQTELDFGSNGKHDFDFVIGADGAWSKVRELLTDIRPHFTKSYNVTMTIREITKKYPHLAELVGCGTFSSLGNKHAVISQRGPMDSSRIYLWLTIPDEQFATTSGLATRTARAVKEVILDEDSLLGSFGGLTRELIMAACEEETIDHPNETVDMRPLYSLPHGSSWTHKTGVTMIGDAAHLMLPNGAGVNAAMFDSLLLSRAIIEAYESAEGGGGSSFKDALDLLVIEFEAGVVERAIGLGKDTDELIGTMFGSDDAAHDFAKVFGVWTSMRDSINTEV